MSCDWVQEAAGSIPVTRAKEKRLTDIDFIYVCGSFILSFLAQVKSKKIRKVQIKIHHQIHHLYGTKTIIDFPFNKQASYVVRTSSHCIMLQKVLSRSI
jgi:hypothetical protein